MSTAILSVSDKQGVIELAHELSELGWELLASGGTAQAIRGAGLEVQDIATYTGSPEILGGRVKTLHPAVHGGILARADERDQADLARIKAQFIDLVVVNLYPFQETVSRPDVAMAEAVENIDIGGVALIRASAKNFERVAIVTDPKDYPLILDELKTHGQVTAKTRQQLAVKAFHHTAGYDTAIAAYLSNTLAGAPATSEPPAWLSIYPSTAMRYGENPHQQARLFHLNPQAGPLGGEVLQGKALSYNNLLDLDAAWRAVHSYERPSISIIKHLSPCGIASGSQLAEAFALALASDPVSAFGGVVAANRPFDAETAAAMGKLFVECIIAPDFTPQALEKLAGRKNCRLVRVPDTRLAPGYEVRVVNQGLLWQERDFGDPAEAEEWKVVTRRQPTEEEWSALRFAWKSVAHIKSNAVVLVKGEATIGIGGGQPNRIDCVRIAIERAGEQTRGAVMASDAFFPFPDSVETAAEAGVTAVIHPGGSVRDTDTVAAADQRGVAVVTTGIRHFRH